MSVRDDEFRDPNPGRELRIGDSLRRNRVHLVTSADQCSCPIGADHSIDELRAEFPELAADMKRVATAAEADRIEAQIREHAPQWVGATVLGDRVWSCSCGQGLDLNAKDWPAHMAAILTGGAS